VTSASGDHREACIALSHERDWPIDDVSRIEVTGHPLLRERTDRPNIRSGRESQVNAQHAFGLWCQDAHRCTMVIRARFGCWCSDETHCSSVSADEFADLPEIRQLAELCAKCGLDQECLSLQKIAVHGESEHQLPC